jgi:hypothetical protein
MGSVLPFISKYRSYKKVDDFLFPIIYFKKRIQLLINGHLAKITIGKRGE